MKKNIFEPKKHYDYDYIEYKGIRDLIDRSIDEDYYKQIKANDSFSNNYIEYESKRGKGKTLSIK